MKLLNEYLEKQQEIYDYFAYKDTWESLAFSDETDKYWSVEDDTLYFASSLKEYESQDGNYYEEKIVGNIYEGAEYTLIRFRDCCGGDDFTAIFDNKKRVD